MKLKLFYTVLCCTYLCSSFSAEAATISGKVLGVDGAPIEDALVLLTQDRRVKEMRTPKNGSYNFDDIGVKPMELVAYHSDYAVDGFTGVPVDDLEINLVLSAADAIHIRVINKDFMTLAGARVSSMAVNDRFTLSVEDLANAGFPLLRTNDEGILDIPCIPEGGFVRMTILHHEYAPSEISYLPVEKRRRDIILYPGSLLRGRITVNQKGVSNARVSVFQRGVSGQHKFAEALTDAEGFYHLRAPEDQYLIAVHHPDYASPTPKMVNMYDLEKATVADLELTPPFIIRGSVVLPNGQPCRGARIVFRIEDTIFEDTFSDSQGKFLLRSGSPDGILRVIPPPGYMTKILDEIPVAMGEVHEVTLEAIRLTQLPVIQGQVQLPKGEKPEQLYITSLDLPVPYLALTEADGSFALPFFYQPDQKEIQFRVEHPFRFLRSDFTVNLESPSAVKIPLKEFKPQLDRLPHQAGRNNLESLLGKEAPPIDCVEWFNTQPLTQEQLKGKVVVLTLWGGFDTSRFSMHRLAELRLLHHLYAKQKNVAIISVHDASSESDEIAEYLSRFDITFPVGRDADPFVTFGNYHVNAIPQTVLIDKEGVLRYAETEGRILELIKALRRH